MRTSHPGANKESGFLLADALTALFLTAFCLSAALSGLSAAVRHIQAERRQWEETVGRHSDLSFSLPVLPLAERETPRE